VELFLAPIVFEYPNLIANKNPIKNANVIVPLLKGIPTTLANV
jgi:hypothetical protein